MTLKPINDLIRDCERQLKIFSDDKYNGDLVAVYESRLAFAKARRSKGYIFAAEQMAP